MPTPSLTPLPPLPGPEQPIDPRAPVTLGSAPVNWFQSSAPGVAEHHATLELRDGNWWIRTIDGTVEVNGIPVLESARLRDSDQIRLAANVYLEFATGETRTRRMTSDAEMIARPRKRTSGRLPGPSRNVPVAALTAIGLAVLLVGGAAYVAWYGAVRVPRSVEVLNDAQAAEFDTLLVTAYDHVERGGTLLELGLGEGAADEFAQAVNTLALSRLRNNSQVKPRIAALEATVRGIYQERRLAVPDNYAHATSPLTADQLKTASLSAADFGAKFDVMSATFESQFGHPLVVTGRDHAEHVFLYGVGGAMDLSIKGMNSDEIDWIIARAHAVHIRVKDFSRDSVLRKQVARAIHAGLLFEAGTGLHLHIDRFANKRDRWTTLRPRSDDEKLDSRHPGDRKLVTVFQRPVLAPIEQVRLHVGPVERRIDQEVLPVLPDDGAVVPGDESGTVADDEIVLFLRTIRFRRADPENWPLDRINLAPPHAIDDFQHRFLS